MLVSRMKSGSTVVIGDTQKIIIEFGSVMGNTIEMRLIAPNNLPLWIDGLKITLQDKESTSRTKNNYGPYRELDLMLAE